MSQKELKTKWAKTGWADKSTADLQEELRKRKSQSFDLRVDRATGKLQNYREILLNKRRIARLQTLLREKELANAGKEAK